MAGGGPAPVLPAPELNAALAGNSLPGGVVHGWDRYTGAVKGEKDRGSDTVGISALTIAVEPRNHLCCV